MKTRKQKEVELRITHVVDIAEELFRKQGFENVTMDQIAKSAEYSKTTIYKSFKSKDELAMLVYQKVHSKKMAYLKKSMDQHFKALDKLKAFGKAYFYFFKQHTDYLRFQLYWDYKGLNKEIINQEIITNTFDLISNDDDYIASIFQQGKNDGSLRSDLDIKKTLDIFYLTLRALMNQILIVDIKNTLGSLSKAGEKDYLLFLDLFIKSLQA